MAGKVSPEIADLIRVVGNFRPRTELVLTDATWVTRALDAEAELARLKNLPAPKVDRKRSPIIVYAEAHVLFGDYVDRELVRMREKLAMMEAGTLDCAADEAWKLRNQRIGADAVALEASAYALAASAPSHDGRGS